MTTYIPAFTLSTAIFQSPAASILLPVTLGTGVGYLTGPHRYIGLLGSQNKKTYLSLKQPPLSPPAWVFAPVWTVLYGLMGYSAYRVTMIGLSPFSSPQTIQLTRQSLTLYTAQLALNLIWTPIFFFAKRPVEATVDITTLVGLNVYLTYLWSQIDSVSAYLHLPYLGWLGFATYLCSGVGYLNGWDLRTPEEKRE
ncbi:hypothetical protein S7711_00946 [Stachybotrys chartarum IBT 7711]|uniref:Uncharacterized protein n=1 Tax=Stachybotrys chartarum (strain CBS 109288 / IBT 7711) TaxID=1280523 RepID=A0A084B0P5_STACB|nr:hypothetical protein S7711_00946 [Stachybotrys chartarum IBT 7711]KFA51042.1 hypothetical protein S40293_07918 [Stachybotrys chartarum IBT 40293]KFA71320.1 hypothetical protein S40288_09414 [Stachybotrys chartarum IBT 40288]